MKYEELIKVEFKSDIHFNFCTLCQNERIVFSCQCGELHHVGSILKYLSNVRSKSMKLFKGSDIF